MRENIHNTYPVSNKELISEIYELWQINKTMSMIIIIKQPSGTLARDFLRLLTEHEWFINIWKDVQPQLTLGKFNRNHNQNPEHA